jgi:tetratricopeptide (TPR) repeat protein
MSNKIRSQTISKWILFSLCYLFMPCLFLESSLINPDFAPELLYTDFAKGYEDFVKGRSYFDEENREKAIHFFSQAVKKSYKPYFECMNYFDDEGNRTICSGYEEDINGYIVGELDYEIIAAIYRHSHFYLGLIRLYQGEIPQANLHFKKAIGFYGVEDNLGINFYKCANMLNPSWINLASLTRLQMGKIEEAEALLEMAFWTAVNLEDIVDWRNNRWSGSVASKYWDDLSERGITDKNGIEYS